MDYLYERYLLSSQCNTVLPKCSPIKFSTEREHVLIYKMHLQISEPLSSTSVTIYD